jgi:folate-dependent tRNA-U54 methylase TrmFO/GidA
MDNNPEIDFHTQLTGKTGYLPASNQGLLLPCKTSPHQKHQAKAFSDAGPN